MSTASELGTNHEKKQPHIASKKEVKEEFRNKIDLVRRKARGKRWQRFFSSDSQVLLTIKKGQTIFDVTTPNSVHVGTTDTQTALDVLMETLQLYGFDEKCVSNITDDEPLQKDDWTDISAVFREKLLFENTAIPGLNFVRLREVDAAGETMSISWLATATQKK